MSQIMWHQKDKRYMASILTYTIILSEQPGQKFTAHINQDKIVLHEWNGDPMEFEEAKRWAMFCVIDLEQLESKDNAQKGMLQTLDLCQSSLSRNVHPSHRQRLENIKGWVVNHIAQEPALTQFAKSSAGYSLDWSEQDSNNYQAVTPHGKALIVEEKTVQSPYLINPVSRYIAQIEHSSGVIYKSSEIFMDFVDAEYWLQKTLVELDDPRVAEYYLGNIHFTLNICKHSLPPEVDLVHLARLEYLELLLDEVLP
jgi:hypothetical protein